MLNLWSTDETLWGRFNSLKRSSTYDLLMIHQKQMLIFLISVQFLSWSLDSAQSSVSYLLNSETMPVNVCNPNFCSGFLLYSHTFLQWWSFNNFVKVWRQQHTLHPSEQSCCVPSGSCFTDDKLDKFWHPHMSPRRRKSCFVLLNCKFVVVCFSFTQLNTENRFWVLFQTQSDGPELRKSTEGK